MGPIFGYSGVSLLEFTIVSVPVNRSLMIDSAMKDHLTEQNHPNGFT
jgi:hypothetical protein